ncbi:uncharacterized protein LOC126739314 isoform X2 [Anthonomus grandis grandis]|nr:uncharacterized protein LOC126739314 isoform X2 [Anthonomus grandis grandis]
MVQPPGSKEITLVLLDTCTGTPLLDKKTKSVTSPVKSKSLADLRKEFGSKKAKRYTEQQERLNMNIENVKEHLEQTVADINVTQLNTSVQDEGESLYRPKINRNASTKEQVYLLGDLVPKEVLDSLENSVTEVLESEDMTEFELTPSIQKYIEALRSSSFPEMVVIEKCKILLYIHFLVKFLNTPLKSMTKKFIACECSELVDKNLKETYMINGTRPLSMRDKGLCYALVLLMLALDYELDLEPISKELKSGLKKVQEFARNLGFSQSNKNKNVFILKIPVPPPVMPNLKRKRSSI